MEEDKIVFTAEDGVEVMLYVVAQTTIAGQNYLLVSDGDEETEEAEAFIMREITDDDHQLVYEPVENEEELVALSKVFEQLMDDVDLKM